MDIKEYMYRFNRAFNPFFVDKESFIAINGSTDGIAAVHKASRLARQDALNRARGTIDLETVSDLPPAEIMAWEAYGDASVVYVSGMLIRVALPYHTYQNCLGVVLHRHPKDGRFFVKVGNRYNVVTMLLYPHEMLPETGKISSTLLRRLYEN